MIDTCAAHQTFHWESSGMALARTTLGEFRGRWLQARFGVQAVYRSSGNLARFKVCIVDRQGSNLCDRYPMMNDMADAMQIR